MVRRDRGGHLSIVRPRSSPPLEVAEPVHEGSVRVEDAHLGLVPRAGVALLRHRVRQHARRCPEDEPQVVHLLVRERHDGPVSLRLCVEVHMVEVDYVRHLGQAKVGDPHRDGGGTRRGRCRGGRRAGDLYGSLQEAPTLHANRLSAVTEATARVYSGRYEILRSVARGGMAEVYLARDRLLGRLVALKILFPELSVDASFVERFRREARAAANLSHPNVVSVHDWGEEDGVHFIVMEYVDGKPLSGVIGSEGALLPDRAAGVGAEVAAGLSFAHGRGVVHRDVKPGNVLIDANGQVKVTDFGIAWAADAGEKLTASGAIMGTAIYFSPEQAQGFNVDARSDIYSLGVVLYEMVTGHPPFTGDSPVAIAYKHVREHPVPPSQLNPAVPPAFEAIVLQAMAKDPRNRYASAEELRADLIRYMQGRTVVAAPPTIAPAPTQAMTPLTKVAEPDGTRHMTAGMRPGPATARATGRDRYRARRRTSRWVVAIAVALASTGLLMAPHLPGAAFRRLTTALERLTDDRETGASPTTTPTSTIPLTTTTTKPPLTVKIEPPLLVIAKRVTTSTCLEWEAEIDAEGVDYNEEWTDEPPEHSRNDFDRCVFFTAGKHRVVLRVTDELGRVVADSVDFDVAPAKILVRLSLAGRYGDAAAPEVPLGQCTYISSTVDGAHPDGYLIEYENRRTGETKTGGGYWNYCWKLPGSHQVVAKVTDRAGVTGTGAVTVKVR